MKTYIRRLLLAPLLLFSLLAPALAPRHAFAAISACRRDPIVQLSNGTQITLEATIDDNPGDIKSVNYTLIIPAGVTVTDVTYDQYASLEHLTVLAAGYPGFYETATSVLTSAPSVRTTATAAVSHSRCDQALTSLTGWSGNDLVITFHCS